MPALSSEVAQLAEQVPLEHKVKGSSPFLAEQNEVCPWGRLFLSLTPPPEEDMTGSFIVFASKPTPSPALQGKFVSTLT